MPAKAILSLLFLASLSVVVVLGLRALPHSVTGTTAAGAEDVLVAATRCRPARCSDEKTWSGGRSLASPSLA